MSGCAGILGFIGDELIVPGVPPLSVSEGEPFILLGDICNENILIAFRLRLVGKRKAITHLFDV